MPDFWPSPARPKPSAGTDTLGGRPVGLVGCGLAGRWLAGCGLGAACLLFALCTVFLSLSVAPPAHASSRLAARPVEAAHTVCERMAEQAAQRSGVPVSVLKAIALTETGRKSAAGFGPWPWTVNMEGAGHWFDTLAEARAFVDAAQGRGARSFDIGCFQINYRWHGEAFTSVGQMFDPLANALYAARFLSELYQETGDWTAAAGAYHSRTKQFASRYSARFAELRQRYLAEDAAPTRPGQDLLAALPQGLPGTDDGRYIPEIPDIVQALYGAAPEPRKRINTYPLLQRRTVMAVAGAAAAGAHGTAPHASLFAATVAAPGSGHAEDSALPGDTELGETERGGAAPVDRAPVDVGPELAGLTIAAPSGAGGVSLATLGGARGRLWPAPSRSVPERDVSADAPAAMRGVLGGQ